MASNALVAEAEAGKLAVFSVEEDEEKSCSRRCFPRI
jgi:hypothetical protein